MKDARYTKEEFVKLDPTFKIEAIISDGMWYTITKWRKFAAVSEEELTDWIDKALSEGRLISSKNSESYRIPLEEIERWYKSHGFNVHEPLVDFIFAPRIWDGMTEVDGFNNAPRREVGVVTFRCSARAKREVEAALRGIAVVRDDNPRESKYKAYGLSAGYIKQIISEIQEDFPSDFYDNIYLRSEVKRREIIDFTPEFSKNLLLFYMNFGKALVKKHMETIDIFLPTPEEKESQMLIWTIEAIEKFDEKNSVPFSGYFDHILNHRPYDLPEMFLGKELSKFQREKSKAINAMKKIAGDKNAIFTAEEVANKMKMDMKKYAHLESAHHNWIKSKQASSLTWEENGEEKSSHDIESGSFGNSRNSQDIELANKISVATINAAINSGKYDDAFSLITQIDASEIDMSKIDGLSPEFIADLAYSIGVEDGQSESN